jgi:hypothetical protein
VRGRSSLTALASTLVSYHPPIRSLDSSLLFTLQLSVCLHVCNIPRHNHLNLDNNTPLLDPRSLYHRHVLYSFLSSLQQARVAHTTIRHAGGSAPASDCDERRPPDHHHPSTTAERASCEQNLCRHSTTTANCLLLSTKPYTASFSFLTTLIPSTASAAGSRLHYSHDFRHTHHPTLRQPQI